MSVSTINHVVPIFGADGEIDTAATIKSAAEYRRIGLQRLKGIRRRKDAERWWMRLWSA